MRIVWDSFSLQFISYCKFIGQVLKVYRNTNTRRSLSCLPLAHPPKCSGLLKIYRYSIENIQVPRMCIIHSYTSVTCTQCSPIFPARNMHEWRRFQERPSTGFDECFVISKESSLYLHSYYTKVKNWYFNEL